MNRKCLVPSFVLVAFLVAGLQADTSTWDAYSQFNFESNTASDTWQYLQVAPGVNGDYSLFGATASSGAWNVWQPSSSTFPEFPFVGKSSDYTTGLTGHPADPVSGSNSAFAVGWKAAAAGAYNVKFSVASNWSGVGPEVDGIAYWLFRQGDTAALSSGTLANMTGTGLLSVNGISVAAGDMLYLQVGPGAYNSCDQSLVSFTVTTVPEPSTIILVAAGLIGLLAYAWRKAK
jgi:hypothetical protein